MEKSREEHPQQDVQVPEVQAEKGSQGKGQEAESKGKVKVWAYFYLLTAAILMLSTN